MAKKRKVKPIRIRGTYHLSLAKAETEEVRSLILRRRLQLLVHSYIYYEGNQNLVSDQTWDKWARELVSLQKCYPEMCKHVDYHSYFKDFDGSTGFDLPYRLPEISAKAIQIMSLAQKGNSKDGHLRHKTGRAKPGPDVIRLVFQQ